MPTTVPTEETPVNSTASLTSSRKWLVQVALLFGLLGLGRWSRYLPGRPLASQGGAPRARPGALPLSWRESGTQPGHGSAEVASFPRPVH